jgi:hypothetical protein
MTEPVRILLQTTIPFEENDWHAGRFSLLKEHLESIRNSAGENLYDVTARDREPGSSGDDPVLASIDESSFDEIWLMAADSGNGLTEAECEGLSRFRLRGGGILTTRDHQDLGSSICSLGGVGRANFFHSKNLEPDEARHIRDDRETTDIDFPNYHSGRNGDFQAITVRVAGHPLFTRPDGTSIEYFPAHPHEGAVGAPPDDESASVVATGTSKVTGASFNLVVAFERGTSENGRTGRAAAHSSFHHFADYNWDPSLGCPDFVAEAPGDDYVSQPHLINDIKTYVSNLAHWLVPDRGGSPR